MHAAQQHDKVFLFVIFFKFLKERIHMLNITSLPWKLFSLRKWLFHILFLLSITSLFYATDPGQNFRNAFGSLCKSSLSILAIGAIVLIVLAAIVYAVGQMLGAETRARATVWASNAAANKMVDFMEYP